MVEPGLEPQPQACPFRQSQVSQGCRQEETGRRSLDQRRNLKQGGCVTAHFNFYIHMCVHTDVHTLVHIHTFSIWALADAKTLPSNMSGHPQGVSCLCPGVQVTLILNSAAPISATVAQLDLSILHGSLSYDPCWFILAINATPLLPTHWHEGRKYFFLCVFHVIG